MDVMKNKTLIVENQSRIALLKTLLKWEGRLNNGRLRELFDLGIPRASQLMREFRDLHPTWTTWDTRTRSYHATHYAYQDANKSGASSQDNVASLTQYLSLVGISHVTQASQVHNPLWSAFPDLSAPPAETFARISEAIRLGHALEISYRSMREPVPHQRIIEPHSLVRAGRRWHVRAFCTINLGFRDYALGRIEHPKILNVVAKNQVENDLGWNTLVHVRLVAHPELTQDQQSLVRFEYFQKTTSRMDTCRGALVSYYIQDVRAATDIKSQHPPEYQLAVENIKEVRPWLFSA
jgi:WYL domain